MTEFDLGRILPIDKGEWIDTYSTEAGPGYEKFDIVTSGSGSYLSLVANNTAPLTDRASWFPYVDGASIDALVVALNTADGRVTQVEADIVQLAGDVNIQYSGITASLQKGSLAVKKIETSQSIKNVVEGRRDRLGAFVADANFRNQLIEIDHSKCYRLRTPNLSAYTAASSFCMFDQNDDLLDITASAVDGYFIFNQLVKSVAIVSTLGTVNTLLAETLEYEGSLEIVSELGVSESKVSSQKLVNDVSLDILKKTSWPYHPNANRPYVLPSFVDGRRFLVDMYLEGTRNPNWLYSIAVIERNGPTHGWRISLYREIPNVTGYPDYLPVSHFITATSPESGEEITIHNLSEAGESGVSGKIAVRWSAIPEGLYESLFASYGTDHYRYRLDEIGIFEKNNSTYIYPLERYAAIESNLTEVDLQNAEIKQDITAINEGYEVDVNFETLNSVITPVFTAGSKRGASYTGWGDNFNKAGVSFNAIRVKNIQRANDIIEERKWQYIRLFVKNSRTDTSVLAISPFMKIDKESLFISEIIFPLLNPETGVVMTLDDTSFSGTEYFIGYTFFNGLKEYAYGGNTNGTQSNFAGFSFYLNNTTSHTLWYAYYNNPCVPLEHLLLSDVDIKSKMSDVLDLTERVEVLENEVGYGVEIVLPDKYVAVVGSPIQLFYYGLIKSVNAYKYNIVVNCVKGKDFRRYWEFTPVIGDVGTHYFTLSLYNDTGILLSTATTQIEVVEFVQSPSTVKNGLSIGDSLNDFNTEWGGLLARQIVDGTNNLDGLTPIDNIEFIGEIGVAPKQYTGYGGWTWASYNIAPDPSTADVWVYTTHDKDISDQESLWEDANSNIWQLETIEATRLKFKRFGGHTAAMPASTNALTHNLNAVHAATINYSSIQIADQNPFWNTATNEVDFVNWFSSKYPAKHAAGEGIDFCPILLGWNGKPYGKPNVEDWDTYIDTAKTFINNLHADYPNCKVHIMGLQYPSLNGGLGNSYGAVEEYYSDLWSVIQSVQSLNKAYQALCNDAAYSSFCTFINISGQFDSENNMPEIDKLVNLRSTKTEKSGVNGVHPAISDQIADAENRMIVKEFGQGD